MRSKTLSLLAGLAFGTALLPATAQAWWNDEWSLRKPVTVDTSAAGANVTEPLGTTPVLVRLHAGNFRFGSAKEDGSDLRFVAGDDKTPLKFHIEKWDGLLGEAFAWVQVPDLKPGAKANLWLYYGNAKAQGAADAKGTYDGNTALVYHFGERNLPAHDVSAWNVSSTSPVTPADGALIGQGLRLDGAQPFTIPSAPSLVWTDAGTMTVSAWMKPTDTQADAVILSRHEGTNGLTIGVANGLPYVEVTTPLGTNRASATSALPNGSWRHLAVTADASGLTLFVDGAASATLAAGLPALAGPITIGGDQAVAAPAAVLAPNGTAAAQPAPGAAGAAVAVEAVPVTPVARAGFAGEIDELRVSKVSRPAGYIRAAAIGEGPDGAKLLTLGQDEETSSWISGYFAVILNSVTLDGWVVIAILMVMAAISWVVMIDKAVYLRRLEKANDRFLDRFRELSGDMLPRGPVGQHPLGSMGGRLGAEEREAFAASSLYRLYHTSATEMRGRLDGVSGGRALSAESIAAIRASLDAVQVREAQKMNRLMVLLTIAISGGPFLGLLGTVVGVMITFAAIAAAGDVNVNAIAPGIAAALVATVAGLAVAIPALFGYNWLLTRIKTTTATMNVFVDELVTKLAEAARHRADTLPAAPIAASAE